jgi:hypothetical protein
MHVPHPLTITYNLMNPTNDWHVVAIREYCLDTFEPIDQASSAYLVLLPTTHMQIKGLPQVQKIGALSYLQN